MPRALSTTARQAIFGPQTAEVFLALLTIAHPSLSAPIRFVRNTQDVTSRGQVYLGWPFDITLPGEFDDQQPVVELRIDNVDRRILEGIRMLTSPPTATLEIVLASSPDTVEGGPFALTLRGINYDALVITGTLSYEDTLNEPAIQYRITPNLFPGSF